MISTDTSQPGRLDYRLGERKGEAMPPQNAAHLAMCCSTCRVRCEHMERMAIAAGCVRLCRQGRSATMSV